MSTEEHVEREPRRNFVVRAARAVKDFFVRLWRRVRPSARVRRTIATACVLLALAYGAYAGSNLHTGFDPWADLGIGVGVALLALLLLPLLFLTTRVLERAVVQLLGVFGATAALALLVLLSMSAFGFELAAVLTLLAVPPLAMWTGALAAVTARGFGQRGWFARIAIVGFLLLGLAGNGALVWFLVDDGSAAHLQARPADPAEQPPAFAGASPAEPGTLAFEVLTYGSGDDRHRAAFGADVDIVTSAVNGRPFVTMPKGWKGKLRERWHGFDAGALPRNGTVWLPAGDGPFPLILCVHGNHGLAEPSDPGYAYLGELFASRGYVFVSVDENFLNSGGFALGGMRKENDARAWMLLEHLSLWREWNGADGHRLQGKVDLERVGLIGHSRGGEAVCLAAVFNRLARYPDDASVTFDYGFGIQGVASIAPVDGQYRAADHETVMRDVHYFTIHGGHDADVTQFFGDRLYRRATFTEDGADRFKASLWIYRANHGQFNTVWGPYDAGPPRAWFLNDAALMPGEDQRTIAKVYLSAFFEAALRGGDEHRALFRDVRVARELVPADAILIGRYEDPTFRLLAGFDEDVDVTTTTAPGGAIAADGFAVWREGDVPMRHGSERAEFAAELGWDRSADALDEDEPAAGEPAESAPPSFELTLPPNYVVGPDEVLSFALAASDAEPVAEDYTDPQDDETDEDDAEEGETDANADEGAEADDQQAETRSVAEPIELSIELVDAAGAASRLPLRTFGTLLPPLDVVVRRDGVTPDDWSETFEPVLQTFRCPLAAFAREGFDPAAVRKVRLVFDGSDKGVIYVTRVGFAK